LATTDRDSVQVRPAEFHPVVLVLTDVQSVSTELSELQQVSALLRSTEEEKCTGRTYFWPPKPI